jgi:UDP-N-acetylmuramoylalanine--D-glutamate ligase
VSRFIDDARALPGAGDRVLVIGFGLSGEAAARHLLRLGASVTVTDDADDPVLRERAAPLGDVRALFGAAGAGAASQEAAAADLVVVSPGVPDAAGTLAAALAARVPVWSEVELAYRMARAPIIGVTGTNGKTTTTQMITASLNVAGFRAVAAGNIGRPLSDAATEGHDVIVAELSSFQLHHVVSLRAPVGVLLNVAPDHIDWHGSFEAYAGAKARLFERQRDGDAAIHHDDDICRAAASRSAGRRVAFDGSALPEGGAGVDDGWIVVPEGRVVETSRLRGGGAPMVANAVAASAAAAAFGASPEPVGAALATFEPLAHRMETVADLSGVRYVNDSKATNPHAVLAALDGLRRVVLIAGGRNKGLDLSALASAAPAIVAVIAIGESAGEIEEVFREAGAPVGRASSIDDAVARAAAIASPGDTVLLSPGCASFDMFADYKARGEAFRAAVKRLGSTGRTGEGTT